MIHKYTVIMIIQIQNHSVCAEVERAEYRLKLKMGEMSRSERRPADWTEAWTNSFTRGLNHHHHHHHSSSSNDWKNYKIIIIIAKPGDIGHRLAAARGSWSALMRPAASPL